MTHTVAPARQMAANAARGRARLSTAPLWVAGAALLSAPFFAAFRSGGYGLRSQLIIGFAAFALLAVVAATSRWPPLPGGLPLVALGALAGYSVWTGLSTGWAPVARPPPPWLDSSSASRFAGGAPPCSPRSACAPRWSRFR